VATTTTVTTAVDLAIAIAVIDRIARHITVAMPVPPSE